MVFAESVEAFVEQAEQLYQASPLKARYVVKYNHSKGRMVLKVTDDRRTVQFKTDQQSDLKKIEKLNARLIHMMSTGEEPPEEEAVEQPQQQQPQRQRRQQPQQQDQGKSKRARRKG